jgi:hypothetical protein
MFPSQLRPTPETKRAYTAEWLELASEIGADKFSEALIAAVRASEYFPVIAKIRQCAGVTPGQASAAEADAAWLYLKDHFRKFSCYDQNRPKLPDRIMYALRIVGGRDVIENATYEALPFLRKDFCASWMRYEESSAAYGNLLAEVPLKSTAALPSHVQESLQDEEILKMPIKPMLIQREMSDADFLDRKEMLRQQAENIRKKHE